MNGSGYSAEGSEAQDRKLGFVGRLKDRLNRTRRGLVDGLGGLILGKKAIDDELLEEIETRLLAADVGIEATGAIIEDLTARVSRKQLKDGDALLAALREDMFAILAPCSMPLRPIGMKWL